MHFNDILHCWIMLICYVIAAHIIFDLQQQFNY